MTGHRLGAWDFPSGNRLEAFLAPGDGSSVRQLRCEWTRFPPSHGDERHYREVVASELITRLMEHMEIVPRRALILRHGEDG